jgi:uncharacterized RDD family membrane protein YckC
MYEESAPFWRRLTARLLDLIFALVLTFVLVIPVGLLMFPFVPWSIATSGPGLAPRPVTSWLTSRWSRSCWCGAAARPSGRA